MLRRRHSSDASSSCRTVRRTRRHRGERGRRPDAGPRRDSAAVSYSACNRRHVAAPGRARPVKREHEILGLEYAGVVESIGSRVTQWSMGDRVMGIEAGRATLNSLSLTNAWRCQFLSRSPMQRWQAFQRSSSRRGRARGLGGLTSGSWALVHAGASGVGTAAIQIAKSIGAKIAVTCSAGKADDVATWRRSRA